jgi:pimeloyl-ACP methyl ester carboxylesterase
LTGDDDVGDIHAIADRLVKEIPDARRATMPGAHVASLEHPAEFDRIVLEFLA